MKKLFVILFVIFFASIISCKQGDFEGEDYGTVIFDLEGEVNLRSIDPLSGLPELSSSKMKIIVENDGKKAYVKEFSEAEKKHYKGSFRVGSKLKIIAIVMNKSGKWKGSNEVVVSRGINSLNVRLKKSVSSLSPIKFNVFDEKGIQGLRKTFSLRFVDEQISFFENKIDVDEYKDRVPSFCRDNKGRSYVIYKDEMLNAQMLRYTSEGEEDRTFVYKDENAHRKGNFIVSADQRSGNVFVSYYDFGSMVAKIFLVEEGAEVELKEISSIDLRGNIESLSVYNNIFAIVVYDRGYKVYFYKYNGKDNDISKIGEKEIEEEVLNINIKGDNKAVVANIVDTYMDEKDIYLLYNYRKVSTHNVSTGGVLRCSYEEKEGMCSIKDIEKLIEKGEYESDNHNIVLIKDEKKELYGPLRFVGFAENVLYIADDGEVCEYEGGEFQLLENKNRLVSLNLSKKMIKIEKSDIESWLPEREAISKTNGTMFFSYEQVPNSYSIGKVRIYDGSSFCNFENNSQILEVASEGAILKYSFDSTGSFYFISKAIDGTEVVYKYSPYKSKTGVVYRRVDIELHEGITNNEVIASLYYDNVRKDLYYVVRDKGSYENKLYKRSGNGWVKIEGGNYDFGYPITIYDGKLYRFNMRDGVIEVNEIEKEKIKAEQRSITSVKSILEHKKVFNISVYNNIVYLLYESNYSSDTGMDISALAVALDNGEPKKTDKLFSLKSDIKNIIPIGFDKNSGELKVFIDEYTRDYDGRVTENINKYATLKYSDTVFSKTEHEIPSNAGDISWYIEKDVWKGTQDIILWNRKMFNTEESQFFAVPVDNMTLESNSPALRGDPDNSDQSKAYTVYDVFCYDQFGNLYVLIKKGSAYYIVRFKLNKEGSYNFEELHNRISDGLFDLWSAKFMLSSPNIVVGKFIMAVYAMTPDSGILYFRDIDNPNAITIKKHTFDFNDFSDNNGANWISDVQVYDFTNDIERQFIAITANKDGVFIAQKELEYIADALGANRYYKSYNIEVRKYPHEVSLVDYENPYKRVDIVGTPTNRIPINMFKDYTQQFDAINANWDEYIGESITDMYADNGVLYALSYKRIGGMVIIPPDPMSGSSVAVFKKADVSGAMWKIWNNTKDAEGIATKVFEKKSDNKKINGGFSPRHFVGILPNMLVVASDDYYCWSENDGTRFAKNYDSAFCFILRDVGVTMDKEQEVKVHFSFNYATNQGNSTSDWIWKN